MPKPDLTESETLDLLREIRDLLRPVADAYQDAYDRRQVEREAQRLHAITELVNSSDKRTKAWKLADGTRTQRAIAREVGMDEANASRFFKNLRELSALSAATNPTRLLEVKDV